MKLLRAEYDAPVHCVQDSTRFGNDMICAYNMAYNRH